MTLDPDVAERIEREMRRAGKTVHAVVNETLRAGLGQQASSISQKPFQVKPHDFGFAAGLDLNRMSRLADELEAAAAAQKLGE